MASKKTTTEEKEQKQVKDTEVAYSTRELLDLYESLNILYDYYDNVVKSNLSCIDGSVYEGTNIAEYKSALEKSKHYSYIRRKVFDMIENNINEKL